MRVVVENTCDDVLALEITGRDAKFLLRADLHDKTFADMAIESPFVPVHIQSEEINNLTCHYTITVYPTKKFHSEYATKEAMRLASVVIGVFFVTALLFVIFDCIVRKRTEKVMDVALKQNVIVSSLFPKSVHAKMMAAADPNEKLGSLGKAGIKSFLSADQEFVDANKEALVSSKPIAGKPK